MYKTMLGILSFSLVFAAAIPNVYKAQVQKSSLHQPRGTATDISSAEIEALVRKAPGDRVSDQAIRIVSIQAEYNVSIGVVHRSKTSGKEASGGIEHAQITEVYHIIEGHGTLVTGGSLDNPREIPADNEVVTKLNGPSTAGSGVQNGASRKLGPGDVVIIPPNTPHWFSEISTDQIVYLVVRIDPHKILPAGYAAK